MSTLVKNSSGEWVTTAGHGTVEYGASTVRTGTFSATGSGSTAITFDSPMPDSDYVISIEKGSTSNWANGVDFWVQNKTANGFSIRTNTELTISGRYTAFKLHSVQGLEELENEVSTLSGTSSTSIAISSVSGISLTAHDNNARSHIAYRVGNIVIVNLSLVMSGTFTGTTNWVKLFDMPANLLKTGESFVYPYMHGVPPRGTLQAMTLLNGNNLYMTNGHTYDEWIQTQIILPIVKS